MHILGTSTPAGKDERFMPRCIESTAIPSYNRFRAPVIEVRRFRQAGANGSSYARVEIRCGTSPIWQARFVVGMKKGLPPPGSRHCSFLPSSFFFFFLHFFLLLCFGFRKLFLQRLCQCMRQIGMCRIRRYCDQSR